MSSQIFSRYEKDYLRSCHPINCLRSSIYCRCAGDTYAGQSYAEPEPEREYAAGTATADAKYDEPDATNDGSNGTDDEPDGRDSGTEPV